MCIAALAVAFLAFSACSNDESSLPDKRKRDLENLSGVYKDAKPYPYGNAFGQRVFNFDNGNWALEFTLGLDPNLDHQVFQFRTHGSYAILDASAVGKNVYNAEFGEDKKFVTLKTEDSQLIEAFGFASCGLTPFVEKDISADGCALWKAVSECPIDHDLLALDDDGRLYFGERPADNDMCSADKRPTSLTPAVTKN
ncbi:MAG: hypothetical protein AAFV25_27625 [Bacteroidota bacterium]